MCRAARSQSLFADLFRAHRRRAGQEFVGRGATARRLGTGHLLTVIGAVALGLATGLSTPAAQAQQQQARKASTSKPAAALKSPSVLANRLSTILDPVGSFAPMLARVIPAVVTVLVTGETAQPNELGLRGADGQPSPLPQPRKERFRSGGSGVIIDAERGHILTNNHVIADATQIEVSLSDGRRMLANLVGRDVGTDIAVIEVAERNLPGIPLGNSDRVRVGDVVLAVGNPFGLEGTATLGIVSALMRNEVGHEAFEDFMQIDAAINPGNSGGALVNVRGELIGINTAGPNDGGKASGIGFAIPINMARTIKTELVANGRMRRGSPGILVEDLTHELMMELRTALTRGAHITDIVPGSSAAKAGIKPGGIVTSIAGKPVRGRAEFVTRIATVPAGTTLAVVINESGQDKHYTLVASEIVLPPERHTLSAEFGNIAGAVVGDIRIGNPLFGIVRGAQVIEVPKKSGAYALGLEPNDVIVGLDNAAIRTPEDLPQRLGSAGMQYRIVIMRGGVPAWVRVTR